MQVGYVGLVGPGGGTAEIWQDGAPVASLSLYASKLQFRRVLFIGPRLDVLLPGSIEVRNASSSISRPYAYLDAFLVLVPVE
jgi:hypothetical protein